MAFSSDGKLLFAWDKEEKVLAWSTITGQPVDPTDPPPMPPPGPAVSSDGSLRAAASGSGVEVTDLHRFDPKANHWPLPDRADQIRYHTEQAAAEQQKQHFTAAFHLKRLLLLDPDNKELQRRHNEAREKFEAMPPESSPAPKVEPAEATDK